MRHPFEGILSRDDEADPSARPSDAVPTSPTNCSSRRSFLQRLAAAAAGIAGVLAGSTSRTSEAAHGFSDRRWQGGGRYTTQAWGEEGGSSHWPPRYRPPRYTTYALGEEGAGYPRPPRHGPPRYTTYALGEEGAGSHWPRPRPPRYTTYALGEEG